MYLAMASPALCCGVFSFLPGASPAPESSADPAPEPFRGASGSSRSGPLRNEITKIIIKIKIKQYKNKQNTLTEKYKKQHN
jgi:hypothetical protein